MSIPWNIVVSSPSPFFLSTESSIPFQESSTYSFVSECFSHARLYLAIYTICLLCSEIFRTINAKSQGGDERRELQTLAKQEKLPEINSMHPTSLTSSILAWLKTVLDVEWGWRRWKVMKLTEPFRKHSVLKRMLLRAAKMNYQVMNYTLKRKCCLSKKTIL